MQMKNGHQFLKDIIKETFRIPKYQRGYRWTEENVTKLLEDIYEDRFFISNTTEINTDNASNIFNGITFEYNQDKFIFDEPKATYCIQPLVVMKKSDGSGCYDVIDGQQRLTTIAIIRAALKNIGLLDSIVSIKLSYESRPDSEKFIKELYAADNAQSDQNQNIDFEFMQQAYDTASTFYKNAFSVLESYDNKIKISYAKYLDRVLCENTQFIWYCVESNDPQKIFANFNTGKMELTNSELIKALFMDPSNYNTSNVKDKQIVISEKWDEIENKLHEPEFWAFVPHPLQYEENLEKYCTRIDIIFEYLVMEVWYENSNNDYLSYRNKNASDKYIFNEIEKWLKSELSRSENKEEVIDSCWRRINRIYSGLKELFTSDNRIYNMAGLYINLKNRNVNSVDGYITDSDTYLSVYKDLHEVLKTNRSKREDKLKNLIKNVAFKENDIVSEIRKIRYSEGNSYEIIKTLIIYNIALLNTSKGTGERFNFLANAKNQWEREHIFASNVDEKIVNDKTRVAALEVLSEDSYINYVKELFQILETEITFTHEGNETLLNIENVSLNEENCIAKFIGSNLAYDGNGLNEILARALRTQKDAKELKKCYSDIEKLKQIENIENNDERLKLALIYSYLKEKDGKFHYLDNADIRLLCKDIKDNISNAKKEEDNFIINIEKLHFNYSYNNKSEIEDWKNWLDKIEDEGEKSNYDIVVDRIVSAYQDKLESILYNKSSDSSFKTLEAVFDEDNKDFIISALEVNRATLKSRINSFFATDFPRLLKDNSLGNMTLLTGNKIQTESSGQNQRVSNKTYREKKDTIYNFFKEGQFVPIGTLLVFTDIYTKEQSISDYWLPNSRLAYLNDMISTISSFIGEEQING